MEEGREGWEIGRVEGRRDCYIVIGEWKKQNHASGDSLDCWTVGVGRKGATGRYRTGILQVSTGINRYRQGIQIGDGDQG